MKEQLEAGLNRRELGGCMAADGRQVKEDVLFRSGELHRLTAEEALYVESLGLTAVCDLRTESHLERVRSVLAFREEYIQAAFDEIRRVHGTPEAFLRGGIGLTEPQLEQLGEWYLEPAAC
ncbi:tyrosine-protein phosphatase [Paenibacillus sp. D51F]